MCFHSMDRKALQALCKQHKIPANLSNAEMAKRLEEHLKDKEKSPQKEQTNGPDFQSMKRKDLQALCKQHQIPANLPNQEMAKRLTDILREKDKSPVHEPINVLDKTESTEMVLDYYSMKYKDLQMLCKKHSIPANLSKPQMAKRLTELIKENEKPSIQVLVNEHDENASETESMDMSMNRKVKKVRFSPEHELFEYTRSPQLKQIRRNTVSKRPSNLSVETFDSGLTNIENVDGHGRVTRSRGSNLVEEVVAKSKRTRRAVDIVDNVPLVSGEGDDNIVVTSRSFRNKGVPVNLIEPEIVKITPENVPQPITNEENEKNVPQPITRRSRRKTIITEPVASEEIHDTRGLNLVEEVVTKTKRVRRAVDIVDSVPLVSGEGDDNIVVTRRSFRNKGVPVNLIEPEIVKMATENVPQPITNEENEKNVPQPITRRSRRKTIITAPVASEEILETDVAVVNCETEKCLSTRRSRKAVSVCKSLENKDELGGDTIIQQKNMPKKRKRGVVVKTDDVRSSSKQSMEEGKNERSASVVEPQRPEFIRKTLREEQVVSIAESAEINFLDGNEEANSEENATLSFAELETDLADCEKSISASKTKESGKVDLFQFDVQDMVDKDITNMNKNQSERVSGYEGFAEPSSATVSVSLVDLVDHAGEVEEVLVQENLDSVEHVGEVEEVSVQENLDSVDHVGEVEEVSVQENLDSVDHVGEVEEVSLQENLDSVEHVSEVEEVSVQENLDSVETGETNVISLEITYHHNNVDYMEASNGISEDNKEDIGEVGAPESFADPEVIESEADTGTHPDLDLADDHLGEDEVILVQNVDHMEAPNNSFDKEDGASEAREVGTPESCDICIYHTVSKSASQLKDTSSGLRIIEGEGDDAETEKEECLNEHKIASDEDDEFGVADLFAGEKSVMNASQDGGIVSGECSAMEASNGISEDNKEDIGEFSAPESFADPEVTESEEDTDTHPEGLADDHLGEDEVILVQNVDHIEAPNNSFDKEDGASEAREVGTPESCDRYIYHTVSKSASQLKDTSSGNLRMIEGEGDDAETEKEECLNEHKIVSDEDDEFGVADQIAGERSFMNASQDGGIVSGECSAMEESNGISEDNKENIGEVGAPESFADPEETESEADTGTHPEGLADDHLGEDEVILVQNVDQMEAPNNSFDKEDGASEAREVGTPESRDRYIFHTVSKSASQLMDTSSGNLRIIEGEGDDAETEKEECSIEHKIVSDEDDEFCVADQFAGERSVMNASQDGGIVSGECSAMEASNGISEDDKEDIGVVGAPESFADPEVTESEEDTGTHPDLDLADDHLGEDEVILVQNVDHMEASNNSFDKEDGASEAGEIGTPESCDRFIYHTVSKSASQLKDTSSGNLRIIEGEGDDAETKKVECLNEHKIASDEDDEFGVADLFSGERSVMNASQDRGIVSGECSALYSDEQRVDKEYSTVSQKPISSITTKICTMRDLEAEHSCREEICIDKSIEVAKTDAGGSLDCHENQEFVMSHILGVERKYEIVQQDSKLLSGENSVNRSDENGIEIKLKSSCEDDWISEGDKSENDENYENRKDEDTEFGVSNLFDVEKSFRVTPQDRGFFHAVESNKGFNESTMCDEVVIGAGSSSSKEISPSKPQSSSKSPGTDSVISDEYGDANIPDKEFSIAQGEEINNECTPKQAEQPKSPSAITTAITNTPMFMPQTCGKEITSPVAEGFNANEDGNDGNCGNDEDKLENACNTDADISMDCTVNFSGVETLCESESHHSEDTEYHQSPNLHAKPSQSLPEIEATVNDVILNGLDDSMNILNANSGNSLTNKENEMEEEKGSESAKSTCGGSSLPSNIEDNQLRWLFAMPSNINSLSEVEKTSRHGNELDRADLPITECDGTTKEDAVAQIKFDEIEFEKCSSSDTGGEINYEEVNVAESVELANTSGLVLSEASDEHLTEIDGEEKEIMSQGESCLYVEATENRVSELTEKIAFSSFGSQRNFDNVEHMDTDFLENLGSENIVSLKSERKLAQTIRAEFEFSDAHIQNPNVLEKNHHLAATKEDTNLSETLVDTTGTPSSLFPKVSDDDDEDVTDRKSEGGDGKTMTMDDVDDNLRSLPDFSDELHNNTLMAIFKSPSVANTLELQSTYKETSPTAQNVDYMLSAAGVPVCGAEDGNGNGDSEKSDTGAPLCNSGGDHEENSDGTEVSTKVQISMPGEESDVGTPVLNLEGDIEENDKETGEIVSVSEVEFPVSEEEQIDVAAAAFGCSEFLKECDVATTIKEYIDNELTCMDEMESGNSVAKEEIESSSRPVCPSVKENARTILIHGTPSKVVDMKENGAAYKSSNFGDFTAVRPAKRKALQDVKWK